MEKVVMVRKYGFITVSLPEGSPDEDYLEQAAKDDEGIDWSTDVEAVSICNSDE